MTRTLGPAAQLVGDAPGRSAATRGAAVAVAEHRPSRRRGHASPASATSPASVIAARGARQLVSSNGTAGHTVRKIRSSRYPWPQDALLVMHSDGLVDAAGTSTATPGLRSGTRARRRRPLSRLHAAAATTRPSSLRAGEAGMSVAHPRPSRSATSRTSSPRASARARSPRLLGFDGAGPDAHRDRRLRDRAQRLHVRAAAARSSSSSRAQRAPQVLVDPRERPRPRHRRPGRHPRRPLPLARRAWGSASSARGG